MANLNSEHVTIPAQAKKHRAAVHSNVRISKIWFIKFKDKRIFYDSQGAKMPFQIAETYFFLFASTKT